MVAGVQRFYFMSQRGFHIKAIRVAPHPTAEILRDGELTLPRRAAPTCGYASSDRATYFAALIESCRLLAPPPRRAIGAQPACFRTRWISTWKSPMDMAPASALPQGLGDTHLPPAEYGDVVVIKVLLY